MLYCCCWAAYWCIAVGLIPVLRAVGGGRGATCGCTTALAWEGMGGHCMVGRLDSDHPAAVVARLQE